MSWAVGVENVFREDVGYKKVLRSRDGKSCAQEAERSSDLKIVRKAQKNALSKLVTAVCSSRCECSEAGTRYDRLWHCYGKSNPNIIEWMGQISQTHNILMRFSY